MKKKYIILILLVVVFLCACDAKTNKKGDTKEDVTTKEDTSLKVGEYDLSLTESGSFQEVHYQYPSDTAVNSLGTYTILVYTKKDDSVLFKVAFSKYENKTITEAMNSDKLKQLGIKHYGNLDWLQHEVEGKYHNYAIEKNGNTYVIDFIYDEDLGDFEEEFMKNVTLS